MSGRPASALLDGEDLHIPQYRQRVKRYRLSFTQDTANRGAPDLEAPGDLGFAYARAIKFEDRFGVERR